MLHHVIWLDLDAAISLDGHGGRQAEDIWQGGHAEAMEQLATGFELYVNKEQLPCYPNTRSDVNHGLVWQMTQSCTGHPRLSRCCLHCAS